MAMPVDLMTVDLFLKLDKSQVPASGSCIGTGSAFPGSAPCSSARRSSGVASPGPGGGSAASASTISGGSLRAIDVGTVG